MPERIVDEVKEEFARTERRQGDGVDGLLESSLRWRGEADALSSSIRRRLEASPPRLLIDGSYVPDLGWSIRDRPSGDGFVATARRGLGRRVMVLGVTLVGPGRLALPSGTRAIIGDVTASRGGMSAVPSLLLYLVDRCPPELEAFVRGHEGGTAVPIVCEVSSRTFIHGEGRPAAALYASYLAGGPSLDARSLLERVCDEESRVLVERASRDTRLDAGTIESMLAWLMQRDLAIELTPGSEYAIVSMEEGSAPGLDAGGT